MNLPATAHTSRPWHIELTLTSTSKTYGRY